MAIIYVIPVSEQIILINLMNYLRSLQDKKYNNNFFIMLQFVSSNSWTKKEEIDSKSAQSLFYKNLEYYFKMKEPTSVEHKEYVVSPQMYKQHQIMLHYLSTRDYDLTIMYKQLKNILSCLNSNRPSYVSVNVQHLNVYQVSELVDQRVVECVSQINQLRKYYDFSLQALQKMPINFEGMSSPYKESLRTMADQFQNMKRNESLQQFIQNFGSPLRTSAQSWKLPFIKQYGEGHIIYKTLLKLHDQKQFFDYVALELARQSNDYSMTRLSNQVDQIKLAKKRFDNLVNKLHSLVNQSPKKESNQKKQKAYQILTKALIKIVTWKNVADYRQQIVKLADELGELVGIQQKSYLKMTINLIQDAAIAQAMSKRNASISLQYHQLQNRIHEFYTKLKETCGIEIIYDANKEQFQQYLVSNLSLIVVKINQLVQQNRQYQISAAALKNQIEQENEKNKSGRIVQSQSIKISPLIQPQKSATNRFSQHNLLHPNVIQQFSNTTNIERDLKAKIEGLQKEISIKQQQINQVRSVNQNLAKELTISKDQLITANQLLGKIQIDKDLLTQNIYRLDSEVSLQARDKLAMQGEITSLKQIVQSKNTTLYSLQSQNKILKEKQSSRKTDVAKNPIQLFSLEQEVKQIKRVLQQLHKTENNLQEKQQKLTEQCLQAEQAPKQGVTQAKVEWTAKLQAVESQCKGKIAAMMEECRRKVQAVTEAHRITQKELSQVNYQLQQNKYQLETLSLQCTREKESNMKLLADLNNLRNGFQALTHSYSIFKQKNQHLEQKLRLKQLKEDKKYSLVQQNKSVKGTQQSQAAKKVLEMTKEIQQRQSVALKTINNLQNQLKEQSDKIQQLLSDKSEIYKNYSGEQLKVNKLESEWQLLDKFLRDIQVSTEALNNNYKFDNNFIAQKAILFILKREKQFEKLSKGSKVLQNCQLSLESERNSLRQQVKTSQLRDNITNARSLQKVPDKKYESKLKESNQQINSLKEKLQTLQQQNHRLQLAISTLQCYDPRDLRICDTFFQGYLFDNEPDNICKSRLIAAIENHTHLKLTKSRLLYWNDPYNKNNLHIYIDNKPCLVLVVKTKVGMIAAFSEGPLLAKGNMTQNGFLMSVDKNEVFIKKEVDGRTMTYDKFFFIFGNSEIRIRALETQVFSNFALVNTIFNPRGHTVNTLLDNGQERLVAYTCFQFHQVYLSQK